MSFDECLILYTCLVRHLPDHGGYYLVDSSIRHAWLPVVLAQGSPPGEAGFFEKNDAFFIIFAIPSMLLIFFGTYDGVWWMQAIGFGIMAYGFAYFLVHDVIIHQRFKWFTRSNNTYIRAIRWAHKMHHKHLDRHQGESFGMLLVARKYWEKIRRDKKLMAGNRKVEYAPEASE